MPWLKAGPEQVQYPYRKVSDFMSTHSTKSPSPTESDAAPDAMPLHENDALDLEVAALLARGAQDTGEPTEAVRLDSLTESEKRVLLALLRESVGHPPTSTDSVSEINQP